MGLIKTSSLARVDLSVEHSEVDEQGVGLLNKGCFKRSAAEKSGALFFCAVRTPLACSSGFVSQHAGGVRTLSSRAVSQSQRNDLLQQGFVINAAMLG